MKPELRAMVEVFDAPSVILGLNEYRVDFLKRILLAALHWRGDELWCGPIPFGRLWDTNSVDGCRIGWARMGHVVTFESSETKARAALEAAAWEQIATWFKEQGE